MTIEKLAECDGRCAEQRVVTKKTKAAGWLGPVGGVLAVLVPKGICPICLATSGSVLSSLGLTFLANDAVMRWLLAGILSVALLAFFVAARRKERWAMFAIAVVGALAVYGGWMFASTIAIYSGSALLVIASCLNLWKPREASLPLPNEEGIESHHEQTNDRSIQRRLRLLRRRDPSGARCVLRKL